MVDTFVTEAQDAVDKGVVKDAGVRDRLRQMLEVEDMSAEEIENAPRSCFIDLEAVPPTAVLGGFWRGKDLQLALAMVKRGYRVNRGVLKRKGIGRTHQAPVEEEDGPLPVGDLVDIVGVGAGRQKDTVAELEVTPLVGASADQTVQEMEEGIAASLLSRHNTTGADPLEEGSAQTHATDVAE